MQKLLEYRDALDDIDKSLFALIAKRFEITQKVGLLKKENNLPSVDPDREQKQMDKIRDIAESLDLKPDFAEKILRTIIDEVVVNHRTIKKSDNI